MRKIILATFIFLSILNLYSQDVDITTLSEKDLFKLIDKAFEERDENIVSIFSSLAPDSPGYNIFEEYLLDKTKTLLSSGSLTFSLKVVEAVLYNNLENRAAQELYTTIINTKIENKERLEAEQIIAERTREEIVELSIEIDKEIDLEEKMADIIYDHRELLTDIDSYTNSFDTNNYVSNFYIYPFTTRLYSSEVYDGYIARDSTINSFSGQSIDIGLGIDLKLFRVRTDIFANVTYNDFLNEDLKQVTGSINLSLGLTTIDFPIFFRTGFLIDMYNYNDDDFSDVAITNLPSGTMGLGIIGLDIFRKVIKLDLVGDILFAPLYTDNLDIAFLNKVYINLNLLRIGKSNIELKGGFDFLYLNEDGLTEYSFTPKFGIGISSYE